MEAWNYLATLPDAVVLRIIQFPPPYVPTSPVDFWISTPFSRLFRGVILVIFGDISLIAGPNTFPLERTVDFRTALDACGQIF